MLETFTFAVLHFGAAFGVAYAFTGSIGISGAAVPVGPRANTVAFYFHEKSWNCYGCKKHAAARKAAFRCTSAWATE